MLLLSMMAVFVSPMVDLEPSALRALQAASLFFAAIVLAGSLFTGLLSPFLTSLEMVSGLSPIEALVADLMDLICVPLC